MGGNALKEYTRRYTKEEYFEIANEIYPILRDICLDRVAIIPAYKNKESYGDMDILVKRSDVNNAVEFRAEIERVFKPNKIKINGSVLSFDYKELQIDLIYTKSSCFEASLFFYSYNDLGLLLGKLARYNRLKFGFDGLSILKYSEDGSNKLLDINLTKDVLEICDVFGLDYDTWSEGFDDLEDVFNYVGSSSMFNKNAFDKDLWTSDQRHRDNKRENLKYFYEYLPFLFDNEYERPSREDQFNAMDKRFPDKGLMEKYNDVIRIEDMRVRSSVLFNGNVIKRKFKIEGKDLGKYIIAFKNNFVNLEEMYAFILENDVKLNIKMEQVYAEIFN